MNTDITALVEEARSIESTIATLKERRLTLRTTLRNLADAGLADRALVDEIYPPRVPAPGKRLGRPPKDQDSQAVGHAEVQKVYS
jgi:hypothetical protein